MARLRASSNFRPAASRQEREKSSMILPNTAKDGRYRLDEVIAGGQTHSRVYRCTDLVDGSTVALKQAKRSGPSGEQSSYASRLFQREAQLLADLHHPDLPGLRDVFEEQGAAHIVMDFIAGETIEARLRQLRLEGKRLSIEDCLCIGLGLCRILTYLHGQSLPVIHRDIKSTNVIVRGTRVFLLDFGIARRYRQDATHLLVDSGSRQPPAADTITNVGTQGYAPREQYGKTASTSPLSDIYSLGALLHYLLSGQSPECRPTGQFTFAPLRLQLFPGLTTLIARMTEEAPAYRPDSDEVRETLEMCSRELSLLPGIGTMTIGQGRSTPVVAHV